jgi:hypothetical protein
MFQLLGKKLLNIFCIENSFKSKIIKEFGQALGIVQKPFT